MIKVDGDKFWYNDPKIQQILLLHRSMAVTYFLIDETLDLCVTRATEPFLTNKNVWKNKTNPRYMSITLPDDDFFIANKQVLVRCEWFKFSVKHLWRDDIGFTPLSISSAPIRVQGYKAFDGQLFESINDCCNHNNMHNFKKWYSEYNNNELGVTPTAIDVFKWLQRNADALTYFIESSKTGSNENDN